MLKNFTGFKKVYHKNLCKLNSIAKRLSNNSIKQTEKDILIDYYSNLNDLNEMYNDFGHSSSTMLNSYQRGK